MSTVEMENWPTTGRPIPNIADADVANTQQKLASPGGVVMTPGDVISMDTMESAYGGTRPRMEHHGQCTHFEDFLLNRETGSNNKKLDYC